MFNLGTDDLAVKPDHTSHTRLYFNEFVANALRDNMRMVQKALKAVRGQKHPSETKNGTKELIY